MITVRVTIEVQPSSTAALSCTVSCTCTPSYTSVVVHQSHTMTPAVALSTLPDELLRACTLTSSMRAMTTTSRTLSRVFGSSIRLAVLRIQNHIRRILVRIHAIRLQSLPTWPRANVEAINAWIETNPSPFLTGHAMFFPSIIPPGTVGLSGEVLADLSHGDLVASVVMLIETDQQIYNRRVHLEATRDHGTSSLAVASFLKEFRDNTGHEYYDPDGEVGTCVWVNPVWLIETKFLLEGEDRPPHWPAISYCKPSRGVLRTYMLIKPLHRRTLEYFYFQHTVV